MASEVERARADVLHGYDLAASRLEAHGDPQTAEIVRQLRRVYMAEVQHLQKMIGLSNPIIPR